MRKLLLIIAMSSVLAMPVYGSSLSDIAGRNNTQTVAPSTQAQVQGATPNPANSSQNNQATRNSGSSSNKNSIKIDKSRSDTINNLAGAADFSGDSQIANDFQASTKPYMMAVMQILCWSIMALLGLSVLLDMLYLVFPPTRGLLGGGAGATSATSGTATSGSFGGGGFGSSGGFGGGFGGGGFGGGFSGAPASPTPVKPAGGAGFCIVSQEAINAATAVNPQTGQLKSSVSAYAKTAWLKLILTPILLALTITGSLQQIGLTIASILINLIKSII